MSSREEKENEEEGQKRSIRRKVVKSKGQGVSLIENDVQIEQVAFLLGKALVGKLLGRK